jgi:transcriptional antiterminator RfaH
MPQHEKKIYETLKKKAINAFLPLKKEMRFWSDRKKKIEVPLFPSYVFVNLNFKDRYKVFEVPGIIRYLDSNTLPTVVPDQEITLIKEALGGAIEVSNSNFAKGDKVVITSGPLKNIIGVLINKNGSKKILLEISSLNKKIIVDLAPFKVKKLNSDCAYDCA